MWSARFALVTALAAALGAATGVACSSGCFTWDTISDSDAVVLGAPAARFHREILRLTTSGSPTPTELDRFRDRSSRAAEAADLTEALTVRGLAPAAVDDVIRRVTSLRDHADALSWWRAQGADAAKRPKLGDETPPADLPEEFALHLRGVVAWADARADEARDAWLRVLALPQAERRFRSVWSAYMLGRSWVGKDRARACEYLALCRDLAEHGAKDTDHLAVASLGWEARAQFLAGDSVGAIELYLRQRDAGVLDTESLRVVARVATQQAPSVLSAFAARPGPRRVMTAHALAHDDDSGAVRTRFLRGWLAALEAAGALDEDADRLAWIAYSAGDFPLADRFLSRLPAETPVGAWISAKLRVREGRLDEAASLLARAETGFAKLDEGVPANGAPHREDVAGTEEERAVVELCRSRYGEALDLFLRTGHWTDACYVAERVLTPDELRAYVDRLPPPDPTDDRWDSPARLRPLLARRLARLRRFADARPYFADDVRPRLDAYAAALADAADVSRSRDERATSFRVAARVAHTDGAELLARECEPERGFQYEEAERVVDSRARAPDADLDHVRPSADERARFAASAPADGRLHHHDLEAAELAWSAAELMPGESQETAEWLREAGSWALRMDEKSAERFFRALVERCGTTPLGREAKELGALPAAPK